MSEDHVYAVLDASCLPKEHDDGEVERCQKSVVMRFDSEDAMNDEADNFFDNVYGSFQSGLDNQGAWDFFIDEAPEIRKLIPKREAEEFGYVIFVSD